MRTVTARMRPLKANGGRVVRLESLGGMHAAGHHSGEIDHGRCSGVDGRLRDAFIIDVQATDPRSAVPRSKICSAGFLEDKANGVLPRSDRRLGRDACLVDAVVAIDEAGPPLIEEETIAAEAPPWARIMPFAPSSGMSTSARIS